MNNLTIENKVSPLMNSIRSMEAFLQNTSLIAITLFVLLPFLIIGSISEDGNQVAGYIYTVIFIAILIADLIACGIISKKIKEKELRVNSEFATFIVKTYGILLSVSQVAEIRYASRPHFYANRVFYGAADVDVNGTQMKLTLQYISGQWRLMYANSEVEVERLGNKKLVK